MTSTYSSSFRFELPADGDRSGTWGQMLNTFMGSLLEDAITGVSAISMTSDGNYTLVTASGATDEARRLVLNVTSTVSLTATRNVVAPAQKKQYIVFNGTTGGQSIQIIGTSGTGVTIPNGKKRWVYFDGTNFVDSVTDFPSGTTVGNSALVTETGTQTLTNKTLTAPTIVVRDNVFTMQDNGDPTKQMQLELSALSAGVTAAVSMPAVTAGAATLVTANATQTLTNKTLTTPTITVLDNALTIQDNSDPTKQVQFQASGITAGNTRTVTVADGDFTAGGTVFNAQTGTTYTVLASDRAKFVTLSNASAVAVTLPQATTAGFTSGFFFYVKNIGAGTVTITPTTSTIATGTALVLRTNERAIIMSNNTNYDALHTGLITGAPSVREVGTRGLPVVTQDGTYSFAIGDEGGIIRHSSASTHTYTIPANASVAFAVGTAITVLNEPAGGAVTIAITSDTLNRGDGTAGTGSRTVPANSVVTLIKTAATTWMITGNFT